MPKLRKLDRKGVDARRHALGLLALRSITMASKFALTLFIARYLGLAELGTYGIITSVTVLAPVLLGFGVSNNLGRDAARHGPASITGRLVQYYMFVVPVYAGLLLAATTLFPQRAPELLLLGAVVALEHFHYDLFGIMTIASRAYAANMLNFIRSAGWVLIYAPLAVLEPQFRTLQALGCFWLGGLLVATVLTVAFTSGWRWGAAFRAAPRSRLPLPHRHGSTALYLNDVANTSAQYIDRYIVGIFLNPTVLGAYVLLWSIANALSNLITTAAVQTRKGELVQVAHYSSVEFNGKLRRVARFTSELAIVLSIGAIALVYVIAPYLGRPAIIPYLPLMFVLCGAQVIRTYYEVLGIAFYARNRDDITLYSGFVLLLASLSLNLCLVPLLGIWGAGLALVASYLIGVLTRSLIIARGFEQRAYAAEPARAPP